MKKITDKEMAELIAEKVRECGGKTYYVGGYVRDELLGKPSKDIDIEVHNIAPDTLKKIVSSVGEIRVQGASFGVYNLQGYDIDIAQPRKEKPTGTGHKDFEVNVDAFIGVEKASERRDFTINAIMKDVLTNEIVDCFGGVKDCENGIIRHVNDDTFREDSLRVLRASQFASRFDFQIAPETKELMKTMDLSTLSKERIYGEMKKALLKGEKPSVFFESLREINQLDYWFPELKATIGSKQNEIYHPEGDVWQHTMIVIDELAKIKNCTQNAEALMLSALCHDFGKPLASSVGEDGKIHNINHEQLGVPVIKEFLNRVSGNKALTQYVSNMTENHMLPHHSFNNLSRIKTTNRMFDKSCSPEDMVLLAYADTISTGNAEMAKKENEYLNERLDIYFECMERPQVTGKDLIDLGIAPSPLFREILEDAHKQHLSGVEKESVLKGICTKLKIPYYPPVEQQQTNEDYDIEL